MGRHDAEHSADEWFEVLARTADAITDTAEESVRVHDDAAGRIPWAAEHARRERRLATAERAAAAAFRNHEIPADEVRRAIRDGGHRSADGL